jgi:glycine/serine hydroxymethyltransferase
LELVREIKRQADLQKSLTSSLVDRFGLMGDRGYRGCEYVEVCESKEQKGIREMKGITLLAYLYGYAIGS